MKKILLPLLLLTATAGAETPPDALRQALSRQLPGATIDAIRETPVPGLYEVVIGPHIYYASEDGRYLLRGHLIDLKTRTDLTEAKQAKARLKALEALGEDKMIIFAPEHPKHTISVFTDIDCGYCRRLHSQIDQYLARGIRVRYLFFPRAGKGSHSYDKAIAVWCAKDRRKALTEAKQGKEIELKTCDHPVDQHMALAQQFGVTGTPMIVTETGEILPGYVPPDTLARHLEEAGGQ
ncbi:thiol:disulfide interchange protein DsbC [Methylomarinovum caldicuralii]|uniref:Thiol:disulfide interchange protein n=1 Tax=Methylomarinovum caldicuralii TaxID=438856 RepID=A0AAU9C1C7_9GAMM|nr:DsbC family protein [Methylomarinovum caldicuralii]BCX80940.1 thiol:disulfide interchange protein DsbC [Methylomarinovum caldicuralii]